MNAGKGLGLPESMVAGACFVPTGLAWAEFFTLVGVQCSHYTSREVRVSPIVWAEHLPAM